MATVGERELLSNFGAVRSADHNEGSGGSRQEAQDELECRAAGAAGPEQNSVNLSTAATLGESEVEGSFAHSHIPLEEFLDIKAGVMTVKVVSFYLRNGCHAHTPSEQVCTLDSLSECLSLHAGAVRRLFLLWYSRFSVRMNRTSTCCH